MSFIDDARNAIVEDLKERDEKGIYRYILPCNPKPYPVSGLQHFLGTAFIAARLAEFSGMDEQKQAVAFLAGLLHDYEKIGLSRRELSSRLEDTIGLETDLYDVLYDYASSKLKEAVEIASKLESGGLQRELQTIAEFVRLGDYLTGSEESWNIAYVLDEIGGALQNLAVTHHLVPVVIGKQRPVVAMIAERLNETLVKAGFTPLISTPTGSLYLSRTSFGVNDARMLYDDLASYISDIVAKALTTATAGKPKVKNLKSVGSLVHVGGKKVNVGNVISKLPNLRQLSIEDIEETFRRYTTHEDRALLIVWSVLVYARTLGSAKENLREALSELELGFVGGKDVQEVTANLYRYLSKLSSQELEEIVMRVKDKLIKKMQSANVDVSDVGEVIERTISIGYAIATGEVTKGVEKGSVCVVCRERVSKPRTLRTYLDRFKRILDINVSELFHPDKQGRPEDYRALEGSSGSVYICPVCEYESIVFPATASFFDGMWASSIIYYPAVSIDLLQVVKDVAKEHVVVGLGKRKGEIEPLIIPDYISSRMIVKMSDERGRLRKVDLLLALELWYYIGGNLVLTTNALSVPQPWTGLPIEMEVSDVIVEESVNQFMRELEIAREKKEWSRTRKLRRILYDQLRTYVMNIEEAEVEMGKTRFAKSGLTTSGAPALDVYSLMLRRFL